MKKINDLLESSRVTWKYLKPVFYKRRAHDFGSLDTPTLFISRLLNAILVFFNINHLGNWSTNNSIPWATQNMEKEAVKEIVSLFSKKPDEFGGYFTSGGTEANIFLLWLAKKYLATTSGKHAHLFTDLTHYSIKKAIDLCGVDGFIVDLNRTSWNMSTSDLRKKTEQLVKKGYKGFSITITLGYSSTGTSDELLSILEVIKEIKKKHSCSFFVWIDAALYGLVYPFSSEETNFLLDRGVAGIVVDFSKIGLTVPNSGIVLYSKQFLKNISKNVEYLQTNDDTLLGGRPGYPAVIIWFILKFYGKDFLKKRAVKSLKNKNYFTRKLNKQNLSYITDKNGLTVGLILDKPLDEKIERYFSLYRSNLKLKFEDGKRSEEYFIYKIFILPHIEKKAIDLLMKSLPN